ncbi:MAG TPA: GMC family oxidoreductase N-terminal domain-containing protein [Chitinophagaceae bacterium]|nr:GMC family oxidoreductase N-terminal domain-containing protein [Chitinophagaceae bacterium]
MRKISKPYTEIKPSYNVVVIGSGYGGGIAASRLSRAGRSVCLLERGKEILPGEYPNTLIKASEHMQVHTNEKHIGSATGMFDFNIHPGISVLVGCGLGGTSLINANVSIRPEDRVFEDPRWPAIIRNEYKQEDSLLQKGFALATDMLKPTPLPEEIKVKKVETLKLSAEALGKNFYRLPINVNFDVDGENHVGVEQKPCNLCGDCVSGCNYHAKNTTLMNYLPDAFNHGAEIFTETSVRYIEKNGDKWHVHYEPVSAGQEKFTNSTDFVECDMVIVSAGTLGSTEILLRSKEKGLKISDRLGENFSGNGDVLGFGYNTDRTVFNVGAGKRTPKLPQAPGPCITGVIDIRDQPVLNDGMIIEDAATPGALAPLLGPTLAAEAKLIGKNEEKKPGFFHKLKHFFRELMSVFFGAYHGAIKNTQTYLVMSHDDSNGKFSLKDDRLQIDWSRVGSEPIFKKVNDQLAECTKVLDGIYIKNPVWIKQMNHELVTVHPLGGCFMGEAHETGVVNHKGQVFAPGTDKEVYESLYITDGSVIPRSVGANPLLTISAISERCCIHIAKDNGWEIDYTTVKKEIPDQRSTVGIQFTETMKGFYAETSTNDNYQEGFDKGKLAENSFAFTLTIRSEDVDDIISNPKHEARMTGTVSAPQLSSTPLGVEEGYFNLFTDDPDSVNTKLMKYRMLLRSEDDKEYYFKGFKYVHHNKGFDEWAETSTLYITIFEGNNDSGKILGQGILHIAIDDFKKQMKTMKAVNATSVKDALAAELKFGKYFTKSLIEEYGGIFAPDQLYDPDKPRTKRTLNLGPAESYPIKTEDGLDLLLTRYNGGSKGPILFVHGFSGNRLTFSIDTIEPNMAEYFYSKGYDVWLFDYRLSNLLPSSRKQHSVDDIALYDYPAAVQKILSITGAAAIDVMAHCVGSVSLFMAMLNGLQGVRSIVSAQIACDFYPAPQVKWKAGLHIPQVLDALGIHSLTAYVDKNVDWENKLFDKLLKLYAVPLEGYCNSPTCHRMTFMFGPLYEHSQLNEATHTAMIEMFTIANMKTYEQLTRMIRKHKITNYEGEDVYMPHIERLRIPITFIHGEFNKLFLPKSTLTTYENLCKANGDSLYKHHIIKGYGHNDCMYGKNTSRDVFPLILEQFEQFYK